MSNELESIEHFPNEIFVEIFKYVPLRELIPLEQVSTLFKELIRSTLWNHFIVKLVDVNTINYVVKKYKFANYDLSSSSVTDASVKLLGKCQFPEEQLRKNRIIFDFF